MSLPPKSEIADALDKAPVPVVFVDVHAASAGKLPRVIGDDTAGGALAAGHLLELGHRRIGFIGDLENDPFGFTSSTDREAGFTQALSDAGIDVPTHLIGHGAHGRYEAKDIARRMLTDSDRPTAIFAASDTQALGVMAAANESGLQVPDDLSVIGYDDIEVAEYIDLTTVRQHLFESGRRGAEILMAEMEQRSEPTTVVHLPAELVRRATTAPPKETS